MQIIPAYSPQARGRSERSFSTWQGRLPQELRLRGIKTLEAAKEFLSKQYVAGFNRKFQVPAPQRGTAFLPCPRKNTDLIFSLRAGSALDGSYRPTSKDRGKDARRKVKKPTFPPRLQIPPRTRDLYFPTATTATG